MCGEQSCGLRAQPRPPGARLVEERVTFSGVTLKRGAEHGLYLLLLVRCHRRPRSGTRASAAARPWIISPQTELSKRDLRSCDLCAQETNWGQIVALSNTLMGIRPSPVVALNRAIAVAQHEGPERGLEEIRAITASGPVSRAARERVRLPSGAPAPMSSPWRESISVVSVNRARRRFRP
jgi:hypothetical protein